MYKLKTRYSDIWPATRNKKNEALSSLDTCSVYSVYKNGQNTGVFLEDPLKSQAVQEDMCPWILTSYMPAMPHLGSISSLRNAAHRHDKLSDKKMRQEEGG